MRVLSLMFVLLLSVGCDVNTSSDYSANVATSTTDAWYTGGTLHNASVSEWQAASTANKMATAADFVCAAWKSESLPPKMQSSIKSVADMQPASMALVADIDAAVDVPADERNATYGTQDVGSIAKGILVTWLLVAE